MSKVLGKLLEIEHGDPAAIVYSLKEQEVVASLSEDTIVPLASTAKLAVGYVIAKSVESKDISWNDQVNKISFNPLEDSEELYPHLQGRKSLALRDAVEVMIASHDSVVAEAVVEFIGGWVSVNQRVQADFPDISITEDPRNPDNKGSVKDLFRLLHSLFVGYQEEPDLFLPVINGLVRQQDFIETIPSYHLNHMTGGLETAIIDLGLLGDFRKHPYLYVIAVTNAPDRMKNKRVDEKVLETIKRLYKWQQ
ncbi:serine hydrolase [Halobacillus locisalis]|uniref:Serine hydrolase n=1 Tax=Halobacillus locisalis TaxID=220753 RepID=A0A838CR29_9BACI|nr:serine hydrolase [Halobacillus locisalis]MBA2174205.1 serine hydrolase [Halobacillus locisalis]